MKHVLNFGKTLVWPTVLALFFLPALVVKAYYDITDETSPPSAFSICCCKRETQEVHQAVYSCKYEEIDKCPEGTKQYKVAALGCPSDLILTKFNPETKDNSGPQVESY